MTVDNPILNDPYGEPTRWFFTTPEGELDYSRIEGGRRPFLPKAAAIPGKAGPQGEIFGGAEAAGSVETLLVNQLRSEVAVWRLDGYLGATKTTLELFRYWFLNPDRQAHHRLFFAQREAAETAAWLLEIAPRSNRGNALLGKLKAAQVVDPSKPGVNLPRVAFKMATGTGKTVVMAMLILYHFLNRRANPADSRFCDQFLLVTPGITIKDRLKVLYVDTESAPNWREDYYHKRDLVPPAYAEVVAQLNARIRITNWHAFEPRILSGNKASPFDGKKGRLVYEGDEGSGKRRQAPQDEGKETWKQSLKRVLGLKQGCRLLVLNDEAHHCYLPKVQGARNDGSAAENEKAAVWFSAIAEMAAEYELPWIYDLSATPYYLSGSGYEAYSLFPWIVTDFGLTESIESGLVKIPYLPERDGTQNLDMPVLRDLYGKVVEDDRHAFPKGSAKIDDAKEPSLHHFVTSAFKQVYGHYEKSFLERSGGSRGLFGNQPVLIVVCNNTSLSYEVFRWIAGYSFTDEESGATHYVGGNLPLFDNVGADRSGFVARPPTILVDSSAFEEGEQVDEQFKRVFAPEIEKFKKEYRVRHPSRDADSLDDETILREVMNTVGRAGELGAHVRCVVSVNMLTEGWDANAVTHIVGLRAFGSQLLCEQVAGRALRRESYDPGPDGRFPPEYAQVVGIPFKVFAKGKKTVQKPVDYKKVKALPERAEEHEIAFPLVDRYRYEPEGGGVAADWDAMPAYRIDGAKVPSGTTMSTPFSPEPVELTLDQLRDLRVQQVVYWIAARLLKHNFIDSHERPEPEHLRAILDIVAAWYEKKLEATGGAFKNMVVLERPAEVCEAIMKGLRRSEAGRDRFFPVYKPYAKTGSTAEVAGLTSKPVRETKKSHVNLVVADSNWEQAAAKFLEEEDYVLSYVKNNFLGFAIPYIDRIQPREYYPDFIARCECGGGRIVNLIIEISGFSHDKDAKKWYVENRWLPAVNAVREAEGWDEWRFVEVTDISLIKEKVEAALAE